MTNFMADWPPVYTFVLVLVLGVSLLAAAIPIGIVTAVQWRKVRQAELDHLLKQELLAQGRSVEEVERLLLAGSRPPARPRAQSWCR